MESVHNVDYFQLLPVELQFKVFAFLTGKQLLVVSLVSKVWYELSKDNFLWKNTPLFQAHKHLCQMFRNPIPRKKNHYRQILEDHRFLNKQCATITLKMYDAATSGYLEGLKAICLHGFCLYPEDVLIKAIRYRKVIVIKFIFQNYEMQIKNYLSDKEDKNRYIQQVRDCFEFARRVSNEETIRDEEWNRVYF